MNPKGLVTDYKAKQAKPVFLHEDPELKAEEAWGPRLALLAFLFFVIGFIAFVVFTSIKPF
jgi:hypothetical protein